MAQYPASGILFQNDRKQNERQPDYTGNLEVDREVVTDLWNQMQEGVEHPKANLVGWRKTSKNGKPFLSLRSDLLRERKHLRGIRITNSLTTWMMRYRFKFQMSGEKQWKSQK
jgi:hypothetical protein